MSFPLFFLFVSLPEPEQLCVYIQQQRGGCGFAGKVSQSGLSGGLPHLPVCHLCVQHDRSHGPDSLRHHPHQASSRPASSAQKRELLTLVGEGKAFSWVASVTLSAQLNLYFKKYMEKNFVFEGVDFISFELFLLCLMENNDDNKGLNA